MDAAEESPIHGDILEAILSHVPLIHLVPVCHVSNSWKRAVSSSLAHLRPIKPWLIVLTQNPRASHVTKLHGYDPRSHVWLEIKNYTCPHSSPVRSSHSSLLYTLTPAEFAFSLDALHLHWNHAPSPRVWRTDPIVARVGSRVVVAGGACEFEDDPLAVEIYDVESCAWETCPSMPELLKDSTASSWLSVAVTGEVMHLTEKHSGLTYSFDTVTKKWEGPFDLRPDESVFHCVTGTLGERLMVAGLVGGFGNVRSVKLWEVPGGLGSGMVEVGEMPKEMLWKVMGGLELGSVEVTWIGDFVYLRNTSVAEELVVCEVVNGVGCEWRSVRNVAVKHGARMVMCGGDVCMEDLQRAVMSGTGTFCVKHM
ncbi:F-box/kelch-repeat protein At1g23390 [Vigna radiata var. radiata]|uniref:F-box/kelch-repeat protein At1g23390 n=1 Tax=Vigna radiata var. radiata TaxID=3916 RepID=A0A1S3VM58_VIGRR|nr:F-box/kelch-repeat protein At1g23390 [Vigna radiata var. radiata]